MDKNANSVQSPQRQDKEDAPNLPGTLRETEFDESLVRSAESVVENFRQGQSGKQRAIIQIVRIFDIQSNEEDGPKSHALGEFIGQIEWIQTDSLGASRRGEQVPHAAPITAYAAQKQHRGSSQSERSIQQNVHQEESLNEFLTRVSKSQGGKPSKGGSSSKSESTGSESDQESGGDNSGFQGQSNKKQRIYKTDMPWFTSEAKERNRKLRRSCNKTRNILKLLQKDPTTVKRWIKGSFKSPKEFPEWDALIKDEAVDLDAVFSALHFINHPEENIRHVGPTEIHFGRPKPAKHIETSRQWTAVWNLTIRATAFLFPHCYDELRAYGEYMERLFSIKSISIHSRLFKYDDAVRQHVGSGQNLLLTNRAKFQDYYKAIVAPDSVGLEGQSSGGSRKGSGSRLLGKG